MDENTELKSTSTSRYEFQQTSVNKVGRAPETASGPTRIVFLQQDPYLSTKKQMGAGNTGTNETRLTSEMQRIK
jgi:hypothetical protein